MSRLRINCRHLIAFSGQGYNLIHLVNTFVIRIREETSVDGSRWYGRIKHLPSGQTLTFQEVEEMVSFIGSLGVLTPVVRLSHSTNARHQATQIATNQ